MSHQVIALKACCHAKEGEPSENNLWYDSEISPKFLSNIDEEGLAIHDTNLYSFASGRNLCVRSNIGCSAVATAFSSAYHPAARAAFAAAVI
jgi:hypothetical protein